MEISLKYLSRLKKEVCVLAEFTSEPRILDVKKDELAISL